MPWIRDPLDFKRDEMTAKVIGISQKLPFFGKRDLMREEAGFEAEAERWWSKSGAWSCGG